ncbi:hypothetical protein [Streptomyces hydrogenans]|uniref:hypothetical protein n=1 Tax=Streptomyces hydrogenans TaxID=1873719 RepID=UPI0033232833
MSDRRLFAVFYLHKEENLLDPAAVEILARASGVTEVALCSWGLGEGFAVVGSWGGLDVEVHLVSLDYYDSLVITFREDDFLERKEEEGAGGVVSAFRYACAELSPVLAFVATQYWPDSSSMISSQEEDVLNGDVVRIANQRFGALFLTPEDADDLLAVDPDFNGDRISWDGGTILFRGVGEQRW